MHGMGVIMYAWYGEGDDIYMYGMRRVTKYAWYGEGYVYMVWGRI